MSRSLVRNAVFLLVASALIAQEPDASTFRTASKLVLVPFNVERDKLFNTEVQPSDVTLREDGHPRGFTVFEGPSTTHRIPLELVLLFDTSPPASEKSNRLILRKWDAKYEYRFLDSWDESNTRDILQVPGADVRISVYHFADGALERLCAATSDPKEITSAFRRLLDPVPVGVSKLNLLPGDAVYRLGLWASTGWWKEATVATLKDSAVPALASRQVVYLFSDMFFGTIGPWEPVAAEAQALGIQINPVVVGLYKLAVDGNATWNRPISEITVRIVSRNGGPDRYVSAPPGTAIGKMTGGEVFAPVHLDRDEMADILRQGRNTVLSRFVVGFVPDASTKPRKHRLAVELSQKRSGS